MAGNREGEIVCGARVSNCTNRFGRADFLSDFSVCTSLARRNVEKRLPYPLLKRRTSDIQRQIGKSVRWIFHITHYSLDKAGGFRLIVPEVRLGKPRLQIFNKLGGAVSNKDGDHAFIGRCHEN